MLRLISGGHDDLRSCACSARPRHAAAGRSRPCRRTHRAPPVPLRARAETIQAAVTADSSTLPPGQLRLQLARRGEHFDAVARLWAESLLLPGLTELPPPSEEEELRRLTEQVAQRLRQAHGRKQRAASESRSLRLRGEALVAQLRRGGMTVLEYQAAHRQLEGIRRELRRARRRRLWACLVAVVQPPSPLPSPLLAPDNNLGPVPRAGGASGCGGSGGCDDAAVSGADYARGDVSVGGGGGEEAVVAIVDMGRDGELGLPGPPGSVGQERSWAGEGAEATSTVRQWGKEGQRCRPHSSRSDSWVPWREHLQQQLRERGGSGDDAGTLALQRPCGDPRVETLPRSFTDCNVGGGGVGLSAGGSSSSSSSSGGGDNGSSSTCGSSDWRQGGGGGGSRLSVAGYVLVSVSQPLALLPPPLPSRAPHQLHVDALAVCRNHRRRGVASALLGSAERLVSRWGGDSLWLHVDASNDAAVQLYSDRGYGIARIQGGLARGLVAGAWPMPPWPPGFGAQRLAPAALQFGKRQQQQQQQQQQQRPQEQPLQERGVESVVSSPRDGGGEAAPGRFGSWQDDMRRWHRLRRGRKFVMQKRLPRAPAPLRSAGLGVHNAASAGAVASVQAAPKLVASAAEEQEEAVDASQTRHRRAGVYEWR